MLKVKLKIATIDIVERVDTPTLASVLDAEG